MIIALHRYLASLLPLDQHGYTTITASLENAIVIDYTEKTTLFFFSDTDRK